MPDHDDGDTPQPQDEQPTPTLGEVEGVPEGVGRRARARARALRGVAGIALVAAVVAVIATSSGGSSAGPASGHGTTVAQGISALLAGIPQSGNTLGSRTAPVTLRYFGDLECSTARAFTLEILPSIIRKWVRSGKLRIEYRSLRTVSEPETFGVQQVAALAAGMQNKLWYYLENFYHEQGREHSGYVTESYLRSLARQVPRLNLELWGNDRHDPRLAAQVTEDEQTAHTAGFNSTPSLQIGRTGSTPIRSFDQVSALDPAAVNGAVRQAAQQTLRGHPSRGRRGPTTVASFGGLTRSRQRTANIARHDDIPLNRRRAKCVHACHDV
jgi:protein-disulfide isomerase